MVANTKQLIAQRLNEAFAAMGLPPGHGQHKKIATKFDVSRETARKWVEGLAIPEVWRIVQIGRESGLGAAYLLLDDTASEREDHREKLKAAEPTAPYSLSTEEEALLGIYRSANYEGRKTILTTARALAMAQPAIPTDASIPANRSVPARKHAG